MSTTDERDSDALPVSVGQGQEDWPKFDLEYAIESTPEGDQCTVFPRGASDETLVTTWITAEAGAFVSVVDSR